MKLILVSDDGNVGVATPEQIKLAQAEDGSAVLCVQVSEEQLMPVIKFDVQLVVPAPAEPKPE